MTTTTRLWAGAAAALVLALLPMSSSGQEGGDPHVRAVLDRIAPPVAAVTVVVSSAPPAPPTFTATNTSATALDILGFDFEPFLRISAKGVQGNKTSRAFYVTQDPTGVSAVPPVAHAGAKPAWTQLSKANTWRWFEPRAQWRQVISPAIRKTKTSVTLGPWSIRARYGSTATTIEGHIVYKPTLGRLRAKLVEVPKSSPKLKVQVVQGTIPGIVVTNASGKVLEIAGRDDKPFARVGPQGVDVNVSSPTWRDTKNISGTAPSEPKWQHLQGSPVLAWLETRAQYPSEEPPRSLITKHVTLLRWKIDATLDGAAVKIEGVTEWIPVAGLTSEAFPWPAVASIGAVVVGSAVGLFLLRRRRAPVGAQ
ncbi:MAG: hypothetical protein ABR548_04205 [Actinomycetota bacterium]